jgi:glucan phosphoethanolaminetransferase (alkaline phosphatase superfamily)
MLNKFFRHALLALVFLLFTLVHQYLFYYLKGMPIVWLSLGKYFATYLFFLMATFIKPTVLRFTFLSLILVLNFFQMVHLSYFGTLVLPSEFYLLFTQLHEIQGTLLVELQHVLLPLALTLITLLPAALAFKKIDLPSGSKILGTLFVLYFIYNPIRTYVTGNTWGRQPSHTELGGMNLYLAFSYFSGRILPSKILKSETYKVSNSSLDLILEIERKSEWDAIVFVLGESLSPHHMSLFGYSRPTTTFLESQVKDQNFYYGMGFSGGVSSDISIAFLLNLGFGEVGSIKAAKGNHCLFKLAKESGFESHFLSSQNAEQLRYISPYICSSSLNDYRTLEDISPETLDHQAADDKILLPAFSSLLSSTEKKFILLHQRGSHAPWEVRSNPGNRKFPHEDKISYYDNSVVEFDIFMKELDKIISNSGKKVLVIYASDHGEALGQNGFWGHGQLIQPAFEVPVLIKTYNKPLPPVVRVFPRNVTHFNLGLLVAEELGFKTNHAPAVFPEDYEIFGNDIDGFAGKIQVKQRYDNDLEFVTVSKP